MAAWVALHMLTIKFPLETFLHRPQPSLHSFLLLPTRRYPTILLRRARVHSSKTVLIPASTSPLPLRCRFSGGLASTTSTCPGRAPTVRSRVWGLAPVV